MAAIAWLFNLHLHARADPGFQVREGALKKIAPRREIFWGISCKKSRFYAKKSYFFPILGGGGRAPGAPHPGSAPVHVPIQSMSITPKPKAKVPRNVRCALCNFIS